MTDKIKLILASASPRRHELLLAAGLNHSVTVSDADERVTSKAADGTPYAAHYAAEASRIKGEAVVRTFEAMSHAPAKTEGVRTFVISADTVVSSDMTEVLGKPKDKEGAAKMIKSLSGGIHYVVGGLTVTEIGGKSVTDTVVTEVKFAVLSDSEIEAYVSTAEPYDKAGGYGIQGVASLFAEKVTGDYANVVGISIAALRRILTEKFGLDGADLIR